MKLDMLPEFLHVDEVIIENQPKTNVRMKAIIIIFVTQLFSFERWNDRKIC